MSNGVDMAQDFSYSGIGIRYFTTEPTSAPNWRNMEDPCRQRSSSPDTETTSS